MFINFIYFKNFVSILKICFYPKNSMITKIFIHLILIQGLRSSKIKFKNQVFAKNVDCQFCYASNIFPNLVHWKQYFAHLFFKRSIFKNFANSTGKHLRWNLQHMYFCVKFLKTPFFTKDLRLLLLEISKLLNKNIQPWITKSHCL